MRINTSMRRRRGGAKVQTASGAALLALLTAACGGGEEAAGGPEGDGEGGGGCDTIRIAYQVIPNGAPIVKHEGWLEDKVDATVEWSQFDAGSDVNRAVASGAVDVGLAGSTLIANGVASGLDYEVPWIYDIIGDNEALVVQPDSDIESIEDLVGKKVATPLGSTTQYSLVAALQNAGVDPADVQILDMQPPDALAAWTRGSIDAAYIWHPTLQEMIDSGGEVLVTSGDLAEEGVVTADLGIVSRPFAKDCPELVEAWLRMENQAAELIKDDPEQAAEIVADEFGIAPEEAANQMKDLIILTGEEQLTVDHLGTPDDVGALADTLFKTANFLKDNGIIQHVPDESAFQEVVNPSYLQAALEGE
jgi:taurine transport system substrate-binding protein